MDDLLEFIDHSANRGLMPVATAQALAVAARNVLGVLSEPERADLTQLDLDAVIRRFNNKRARDFNPSSLKEYGRRVHRAIDLFLQWRENPADFTIKTRTSNGPRKKEKTAESDASRSEGSVELIPEQRPGTYQSSLPVRPGLIVTLSNVPHDLTAAEAERLASFIKMLAVG